MIGVIDYGLGNISAFLNVYSKLGIKAKAICKPSELEDASKLILPGVGSFDYAMNKFISSGFKSAVNDLIFLKNIPLLGVCVGMQMLANFSSEGNEIGLGWIKAEVRRLTVGQSTIDNNLILPHMGWNSVEATPEAKLFQGIERGARFYFLHSYYFDCYEMEDSAALSSYGITFTSSIERNNIYGVQFHPEKSHDHGCMLLKNFSEL